MANASRDSNFVPTLTAISSVDGVTIVKLVADPTTGRLLVDNASSRTFITETFTSTNGQTVFTASHTPTDTEYVAINGSIQTPSSDYSISGATLTLASGIPSNNIVLWRYQY